MKKWVASIAAVIASSVGAVIVYLEEIKEIVQTLTFGFTQ